MSAWQDVWNLITSTFDVTENPASIVATEGEPGSVGSDAITAGNVVGGVAGAWGAVEAFLTVATDWHLWASLGWLLAGLVLVAIGVRMWAGKSAVPLPAVLPV
jgi:hypothetical protein